LSYAPAMGPERYETVYSASSVC